MPEEEIRIKNGNRIREWLIFAGSLVGMIVTATLVWATLMGRVDNLEKDVSAVHVEGTRLSQQNCRDIIAIKADVKYTRLAVDKIDSKLERLGGLR